jgi:hypothetical protein
VRSDSLFPGPTGPPPPPALYEASKSDWLISDSAPATRLNMALVKLSCLWALGPSASSSSAGSSDLPAGIELYSLRKHFSKLMRMWPALPTGEWPPPPQLDVVSSPSAKSAKKTRPVFVSPAIVGGGNGHLRRYPCPRDLRTSAAPTGPRQHTRPAPPPPTIFWARSFGSPGTGGRASDDPEPNDRRPRGRLPPTLCRRRNNLRIIGKLFLRAVARQE